jgi:glutathione S-transferase
MSITLNYLPLRARAEATRMILEHGKVPYDYVELSFGEWGEAKEKGEICNFGQLPSMKTVKGTVISQSGAIVRYCAKLAG